MSGGSSQSLTIVDTELSVRPKKKTSAPKKKAVKKAVPHAKKQPAQKPIAKKTSATNKIASKKAPVKKTVPEKKVTGKKVPITKITARLNTKRSFTALRRDPLGHLLIEKQLRDAGFQGLVSSDKNILDAYSTDESIFAIKPQLVLSPKSKRDIEIAVKVIGAETGTFPSLSLTPRAAGTGLSGGSLTDSIVIDLFETMQNIGKVRTKKEVTTITCDPGVLFSRAEAELKKHGCYLPFAPASKDICSIGGAVANNAAGPDSLKYGHAANWIESLEVVLRDGKTYVIEPLTYKAFQALLKKENAYSEIAANVLMLIEQNETAINDAKPHTAKNTAGYPLWNVLSTSVSSFKKGEGTFDLTQLIAGSQGTIGIVTGVTLRAEPLPEESTLIMLPIFDAACTGSVIQTALQYNPINIEIFDALTFDLALKNPKFFRGRIQGINFYKVMYALYTTYHVRYRRKIPAYTLLITLDRATYDAHGKEAIVSELKSSGCNIVRFVESPDEREMWWQVRRGSYTLSKLQDPKKRPAAFLEDMTVPPEHLAKFFDEMQKLLKKFSVTAALHGHGGNGHFHFYPLLDFEDEKTPKLVEEMSEAFFSAAVKHGGSICGEHNDGIIRTPHLAKMFDVKTIKLFEEVEHIFDPQDIFNPGKKVHPRYDIKDSIRKTN